MNDIKLWFKNSINQKDLAAKLQKIKLIITDIDGSLTDSKIYPFNGSDEIKGYSVQDGFGTIEAQELGLKIALITGKTGKLIEERAKILKIPKNLLFLGQSNFKDKIKCIEIIKNDYAFQKDEILFFGDDFLDIESKEFIGLFACPSDAIFYIIPKSDIIVPKTGGNGSFRLLLDLILYIQGKHFAKELIDYAISH